jgi:hypothetical protein
MLHTPHVVLWFSVFWLLNPFPILPALWAQNQTQQLPTDPKEFINAAANSNGLIRLGLRAIPWHMTATYQLFDKSGLVSDEGTYEEFSRRDLRAVLR